MPDNDQINNAFRRDVYSEFYRDEFTSVASDDYARDLAQLTEFVKQVISTTDISATFRSDSSGIVKKPLPLTDCIRLLLNGIRAIRLLPDEFEYEEEITAVIRSCNAFQALLDTPLSLLPRVIPNAIIPNTDMTVTDLFFQVVEQIRIEWRAGGYAVKSSKRISRLKQQYRGYCEYADALFKKHSELIVIRLDFSYLKAYQPIDVHQAVSDLDRLISNMRKSPVLKGLEGYIIKLEYGITKGIHFHCILFFNRSVRHRLKHDYIAEEIGKYWKEKITEGRGNYWNSNAHMNQFLHLNTCGIGPIHRDDSERRANLKDIVIAYLFKSEQFIRPKFGSRVRTFRRKEVKIA